MTQMSPNALEIDSWEPIVGSETRSLIAHLLLDEPSAHRLLEETTAILKRCGNPNNAENSEIGLVFGYVQSGKTMSFTTLTALAKDNGYQLIVIIAGISTNLVNQSFTRLEKDLRLDSRSDLQWISFKNPRSVDNDVRNQIQNVLNDHRDSSVPADERRTILITVMKQKNHLPNLGDLLSSLNLSEVPTLVIDDEGDQQSMNTRARRNATTGQRDTSPIHQRIVDLRDSLPHHTFIQYTATPQAPLFIDIMDALSPNFIQLLTPGADYTGGKAFFQDNTELIGEIEDVQHVEDLNSPPDSLVYAMQIFFLGVVKGRPNLDGKKRSMMIHPSRLTYTHADYIRFVNAIKRRFTDILELPNDNPDKQDLISEFKLAYDDLSRTADDLFEFDQMTPRLRHAISSTVVQQLNSSNGNNTNVDWRNSYSFILIGGQAMDRGFTVEGLTVTYMPRNIGVGNADTIQQRARFFGYKRKYLGYCRVYLDSDARNAFTDYVEHEEDMRRRLFAHVNSEGVLNTWYREVFLTSDLHLARRNIFSKEFVRSAFGDDWTAIKQPHYLQQAADRNKATVKSFLLSKQMQIGTFNIPYLELRLVDVFENLLETLRFLSPDDSGNYGALLYVLEKHLEEFPDEMCTVFLMSSYERPRIRTLTAKNQVNQIFQGRNNNYNGDRKILGDGITFQIHILNLQNSDRVVVNEQVTAIASYLGPMLQADLIRWAE